MKSFLQSYSSKTPSSLLNQSPFSLGKLMAFRTLFLHPLFTTAVPQKKTLDTKRTNTLVTFMPTSTP